MDKTWSIDSCNNKCLRCNKYFKHPTLTKYCPKCQIDVEAEIKVSHSAKNPNKEFMSCPKGHFMGWTGKIAEEKQVSNQDEVWIKKDQMNSRQTAINCASTLIAALMEAKGKDLDIDTAANETLRIASRFYDFVYEGKIQELSDAEAKKLIKDIPF